MSKNIIIKTNNNTYKFKLHKIQIEITGRCNMSCQHCRAVNELPEDMPIEQIIKIIQFTKQFKAHNSRILISGGEPLMHKQFFKILNILKKQGEKHIGITTNGSLIKKKHLYLIDKLKFNRFTFAISLDSLNPKEHDQFRGYPNAFKKAIKAIKLITKENIPNINARIHYTIKPHQIKIMEKMLKFAQDLGCIGITFSGIHPFGKARQRPDLWMNKNQKQKYIKEIIKLQNKYNNLHISCCEPIIYTMENYKVKENNKMIFKGCDAGIHTLNFRANGDMTPCPAMELTILNVINSSIKEITKKYQKNKIIKNLLDRNLRGKCKNCSKKSICGGGRRCDALSINGDYLDEDPFCWLS